MEYKLLYILYIVFSSIQENKEKYYELTTIHILTNLLCIKTNRRVPIFLL